MNSAPARTRGRRKLVLLALFAISPIVVSYAAYYWFTPGGRVNYGELLDARPVPPISGAQADGAPFRLSALRGKWLLLVVTGRDCGGACLRALYATRQARTIQGREQERVVRVWLQPADASSAAPELLMLQAELVAARVDRKSLAQLPVDAEVGGILLADPHGNLVLRYPADPDIKRLAKDLERLLRASQIG